MLGYIYVLFIIPFCLFSKSVYNGKVNKKVFSFILVIVILLISLIFLGYFNIFAAISDKNDKANIARYEQLYLLIKDLTIYGRGLGAIIPGYSRNLDKPYGFELSYLSLIHKFGILSILVIILYLKTISKAMKNIFNGVEVKYSVISIGAMGFLLPSIGNPLLFAPQAVTLHCLALYLLNNRKG
jgi:membrane-associated HD superfamily phosphohydrolase